MSSVMPFTFNVVKIWVVIMKNLGLVPRMSAGHRTLEYDAKTSRIVKNHSSKENSLISGNWQDSLRNQLIGLEIHRNWIRISMRKG